MAIRGFLCPEGSILPGDSFLGTKSALLGGGEGASGIALALGRGAFRWCIFGGQVVEEWEAVKMLGCGNDAFAFGQYHG